MEIITPNVGHFINQVSFKLLKTKLPVDIENYRAPSVNDQEMESNTSEVNPETEWKEPTQSKKQPKKKSTSSNTKSKGRGKRSKEEDKENTDENLIPSKRQEISEQ